MFYTYIIRCSDNSLYTGYTNNLYKRMKIHFSQKTAAAKYTKSHHAVKLEVAWQTNNKSYAYKLESYIKKLSKKQKENLIKDNSLKKYIDADLDFRKFRIVLRKIVVGKTSGFCTGVNYTVKKAEEVLKDNTSKVYCIGEIVHNERVISNLTKLGLIFVKDLSEVPNGKTIIIRAHGDKKELYDMAESRNIKIIDLTCGKIRLIKNKIRDNRNSFIIIIGKKNHPETIGTLSFCETGIAVERNEDLKKIKAELIASKKHKIYVVSQTTFNENDFNKLSLSIKKMFDKQYDIIIDNTICNATHDRQLETKKMAMRSEAMIIIGGKNSSNTKELYNIAKKYCKETLLVQDAKEIDLKELTGVMKIGIMAGASTTKEAVDEVIMKLS